jgi:DNA-binding response OmpR family regulator
LGGAGAMIETVRGAGYRLAARSPAASGAAA